MSLPFVSRSAHAALDTKMGELNQEYQNFRRRNASVREDAYRQGGSDAIAALLPVYDNLKLALEHPCQDKDFRTGIELTLQTWVWRKSPPKASPLIPGSTRPWSTLRIPSMERAWWCG